MVSAILLAAGESKRMGEQDKLFLKYKGNWIINHVMQSLWASKKSELIIVMNNNDNDLLNGQKSEDIQVVINPNFRKGMTTSIQAGVNAASDKSTGYMICLADQPLMQASDYNEIIERFEVLVQHDVKCIVVPLYNGQKGNPVIFSSAYRDEILGHAEMEGCKEIVKANMEHVYNVEMINDNILKDVDTPGDYDKLISVTS